MILLPKTHSMNIPVVETCDKGYKGTCCCMCQYQEPVHKHPWNKSELAKGRITEVMGYVCRSLELPNIFSESQHGCCELYLKRKINDRN